MIHWLAITLAWQLLLRIVVIPPENYYNQGNRAYQAGAFQQAEQAYLRASAGKHLQAWACYNAGNAAYMQGKYALAIACFEKTLDADPGDEDAWFNLDLARRKLLRAPAAAPLAAAAAAPNSAQGSPGSGQGKVSLSPNPDNRRNPFGRASAPKIIETEAERILEQIQAQESQAQRPPKSGNPQPTVGNRDIFSQTPGEILETMRALTKGAYPFKPGAMQSETIPSESVDEVDW